MRTLLAKVSQHDFGMRAHPHRRTPCSRAARRIDLHLAEGLQPVGEFAEGAPGNEVEREQLAASWVCPESCRLTPACSANGSRLGT